MMYINYNRLFNLHFFHDYFVGGDPDNVNLYPTSETMKKLRGGRMLLKTIPGGVTVLYRALEDEVTPVTGLSDLRLTFELRISDVSKFHTITQLDESSSKKYRSSNVLYFKNEPDQASSNPENPESLEHELIDAVRHPLFTYTFSVESLPDDVLLKISDDSGNPVSAGKDTEGNPLPFDLTVPKKEDGSYSRQIDLRGKPRGKYILTVRDSDDTTTFHEYVIYADEELAGKNILGVVDIIYDSDNGELYDNTEEYELRFTRKETFWRYFIVNKNRNIHNPEELNIDDSSSDESDFYSPINFNREGDAPHTSIQINGMETIVFKSADPIPFFEIPKSAMKLKKSGSTVLIKNLPNPSHYGVVKKNDDEFESEIYVFI